MTNKLLEKLVVEPAILNADIVTLRESSFRAAKDFFQYVAHLQTSTVAQTKIATLRLLQATDSSGTGKKLLGTLKTYTAPTGGGTANLTASATRDDLDEGFTHIAVEVDSDNATAVIGAAVLLLGDPVYSQAV